MTEGLDRDEARPRTSPSRIVDHRDMVDPTGKVEWCVPWPGMLGKICRSAPRRGVDGCVRKNLPNPPPGDWKRDVDSAGAGLCL